MKIFCKKIKNFENLNSLEYALDLFDKKKKFVEIFMGWNEKGIALQVQIFPSKSQNFFDETIELFFDTRDLKNKNHFTRYCHHFLFEPISDVFFGKEITRFMADDTHPLAMPEVFEVAVKNSEKKSYRVEIFLPASILFGYDPHHFSKIGFAYHIRSKNGEEEMFPNIKEFSIRKNPSLWSTVEFCP